VSRLVSNILWVLALGSAAGAAAQDLLRVNVFPTAAPGKYVDLRYYERALAFVERGAAS
jgi:hypothetical protein